MSKYIPDNLQELLISIFIFLLVFGTYYSSKNTTPCSDSMWSVYIAMSVLKEGNTTLDEYSEVIAERNSYGVNKVDGHLHSNFPLGTPIMAVPFVFAVDKLSQQFWAFDLHNHIESTQDEVVLRIELLIASFITVLACVITYWMNRLSLGRKKALILVLLLAFCTSMWSTASRALWQHGPSVLMLSISLYLVLVAKNKSWLVQFASIPLAYAYIIRPTNCIPVFFMTVFVLLEYRQYFFKYCIWAALIAIPFVVFNLSIYGNPLPPYYSPQQVAHSSAFLEALAGNLVSPARGLLVYSPIFLFVGYGIILKIRKSQWSKLDSFILCILFFHWCAVSSFPHWWGGHSFGPRFLTDMLPYLIYWLIPVLSEISLPITPRKLSISFFFLTLVLISFFMHFRGATRPVAAFGWNWRYGNIVADVDQNPARLWDWSDPQFWRGLRPGNISVSSQALYIKLQQGNMLELPLRLTINNIGDGTLVSEVQTPYRMNLAPTYARAGALAIPGLNSYELMFSIDTTGYDVGVHSLGGIYVSGRSTNGGTLVDRLMAHLCVTDSPVIIPVTVEILPKTIRIPANDLSHRNLPNTLPIVMFGSQQLDLFVPPVDILVNGHRQLTTSNQIQAVYGTGWYDLEYMDDFSWRWAMSPAEIYIYSPLRQETKMESMAVALHKSEASQGLGEQGILNITTNNQSITKLSVRIEEPFVIETELQAGWNVIAIELEAGNFSPADMNSSSGDKRQLSFALGKVNINTE